MAPGRPVRRQGRARVIDAFVDTNVFVYAVDTDEPGKRAAALTLLDELKGRIAVSAQVLNEYYVTVTRKLARPQPLEQAERSVRSLAKLPVVAVDRELAVAAVVLSRSAHLSLWDAAIIAAAQRAGCTRLYSEDLNAGQAFDGITIVDPFVDPPSGAPLDDIPSPH
jgi:predicted nucleic acid-binding protein